MIFYPCISVYNEIIVLKTVYRLIRDNELNEGFNEAGRGCF
jgi:hypothetical protein